MARERLGGMGDVGREEEAKSMLKKMVASYRTSLDTLKCNIVIVLLYYFIFQIRKNPAMASISALDVCHQLLY
jgi:hypothetical protein